MGHRRRHDRHNDRNDRGWDVARLAALCHPPRFVDWDGVRVPYLRPRHTYVDHEEYDRRVCALGVEMFSRPAMDSDFAGLGRALGDDVPRTAHVHVIVREIHPGVRCRLFVHFTPTHEAN